MNMGARELLDVPSVTAWLAFPAEPTGTLVNYLDREPPAGVPQRFPRVRVPVPIHNARAFGVRFSLDDHGFALVHHPQGTIPAPRDPDAVVSSYYPSVAELVARATGARHVVVFDHTFRSSAVSGRTPGGVDIAVDEVHNDYNVESGPRRVRELLRQYAPNEITGLDRRRFAIINVWRPTNGPVEQMPLAVCDRASLSPGDFVPAELRWPHRTGHISALRYNPAQRWFYFPRLAPDEALLLTCYDSTDRQGVHFGAHTAFVDPTSPPTARIRESVEARVIVLY
jgi:hypothetical protein